MRRHLMSLILFTLTVSNGNTQPASLQFDTALQRLGYDFIKEPKSAGLSIGIYHLGQSYFYNFGTTQLGRNLRPTNNSLYEIGSLTKTFVSLLLAKAVIDHKVDLKDDIRKYLDGNYPNLEYDHRPIQLLHLANLTSGLPDWLPAMSDEVSKAPADSAAIALERMLGKYTRRDFYDALAKATIDTVPGYHQTHSNAAAQLLAYIVERIYHAPLDQAIQENILSSLDMSHTSFANAQNSGDLVRGYDGNAAEMPYFNNTYYQGAGGLRSCATDMVKYINYLMLNDNMVTHLVLHKTIGISAATNKVVTFNPENTIDPTIYSVSLNWLQYSPEKGKTQIWTDGGTSGFCSYIIMYPEANLGIIILSNKTGEKNYRALPDIAENILRIFSLVP